MAYKDSGFIGKSTYYGGYALKVNKNNEGKTAIEIINEAGLKGWELVSVSPLATMIGDYYAGVTGELLFTFKRPIE
ncbi:MAG: hypothetical protein WCQ41_09375 [Bacillota bacterium]